jgi:serine/threonine protein kinase/WD40 repeat protein
MPHPSSSSNGTEDSLFGQVAGEFSERLARGESPEIDEYLTRYPQIAESIRDVFPALQALHDPAAVNGASHGRRRPWTELGERQRLGDFLILREVGRGGMGIVYEAQQLSMGRRVALKILPFVTLTDDRRLKRFRNEIRAVASLSHPNIVSIYSVGEEQGVHYYAMQLIRGHSLADVIGQLRQRGQDVHRSLDAHSLLDSLARLHGGSNGDVPARPPHPQSEAGRDHDQSAPGSTLDSPSPSSSTSVTHTRGYIQSAVRMIADVAGALEHAHQLGIVHRDIKPANLLLNAEGVISVTDFGVARVGDETGLSLATDLVGTLRYMAPEQASGRGVVDHRADIYSLGGTLYELLTLKPVFDGVERERLLHQIISEEPIPPRKLDRRIPRDLQTIVLKALAKEPADRYDSAAEFQDDLLSFLEHRPIKATPTGVATQLRKLARRHPMTFTILFLFLATLSVASIFLLQSERRAQQALGRTRDLLYAADIRTASQAVEAGELFRAQQLLDRQVPKPGEADRRDFAWHYLASRVDLHEIVRSTAAWGNAVWLAVAPDGYTVASGHESGAVVIWSTSDWQPVCVLSEHQSPLVKLDFRADGVLVSGDDSGKVIVWDLAQRRPHRTWQVPDGSPTWITCAPQGTMIAVAAGRDIWLWDGESSQPERPLRGTNGIIASLAFSPNGQWLASSDDAQPARIWELATRTEISGANFAEQEGTRASVVFSPDSRYLLLGHRSGEVATVDRSTGSVVRHRQIHTSNVYSMEFSPDGKYLLSGSKDMTTRLTNLSDMDAAPASLQHPRRVYCARFLAGGRIVSCSRDETVRIWKRQEPSFRESTSDSDFSHDIIHCNYSTDGSLLAVCCHIGSVALFSLKDQSWQLLPFVSDASLALFAHQARYALFIADDTAGPGGTLRHPTDRVAKTDIDGDGDLDLIASLGERNASVIQQNHGHGRWGVPRLAAEAHRGSHETLFLASAADGSVATKWHVVSDPGVLYRVRGFNSCRDVIPPGVVAIATADFDHNATSDLLVATESDESVCWYGDVDQNQPLQERRPVVMSAGRPHDVLAADVDDDTWVDAVVSSTQGIFWCRNLHDGSFSAPIVIDASLTVPARMEWADCDQDGRQDLVVATDDRIVWYGSRETGQLDSAAQLVRDLRSASWLLPIASTAVIWGLDSNQIEHHFSLHADLVTAAAISPDDQWLATAGRDNRVRIWRLPSGTFVRTLPDDRPVDQLLWSRDANQLLVSSEDVVYVWDRDGQVPRAKWMGHENTVSVMATSHNGELVATASHDLTIRLWSLKTGASLAVLVGHKQRPKAACFSPDDRVLATLGEMGTIRLWHVATGQELIELNDWSVPHGEDLYFSDAHTLMATGSEGRLARIGVWKVQATGQRRQIATKD